MKDAAMVIDDGSTELARGSTSKYTDTHELEQQP
jgi:hypothetical protein